MDLYGDQVLGGNWINLDVEAHDLNGVSFNGDSVQEAANNIQQFVETSEAANQSLMARTEFVYLVQFLVGVEGGPSTLESFRAHLQREGDDGRYTFPVLPVGDHEELLNP